MLAAIKSLYASGTLSMKVGGAAGPSLVQQNGVRQGCPLRPTLFGIFFDGLKGHLDCSLPRAGLQLGSGRWMSALVYARPHKPGWLNGRSESLSLSLSSMLNLSGPPDWQYCAADQQYFPRGLLAQNI